MGALSLLQLNFVGLWTTAPKMRHFSFAFSNKTTEFSTEESPPSSSHSGIVIQAVFGVIALLSFLGNFLFCVVLLRKRKRYLLKKPYNILLLVLAVTDMLTGTNSQTSYISLTQWPFANAKLLYGNHF